MADTTTAITVMETLEFLRLWTASSALAAFPFRLCCIAWSSASSCAEKSDSGTTRTAIKKSPCVSDMGNSVVPLETNGTALRMEVHDSLPSGAL
jgi:hypothetical protein